MMCMRSMVRQSLILMFEYRPTVIRYDVSTTHVGPAREFGVTFASSSGNKIEIIGYDIEAKVGEQKNIKPLNKALRPTRR